MAKASGTESVAESDRCEMVEASIFQPEAVKGFCNDDRTPPRLEGHRVTTRRGATGKRTDAAWYYPDPKPAAKNIAGYVAFWKGIKVET